MSKLLITAGAAFAGLAVAAGAFGAHALEKRLEPRMLEIFETGARYQMYHALALILCAVLAPRRKTGLAGHLFLWGVVVFSGTLYALVLTGTRWLGAITPIGGVLLILGWLALAVARTAPDSRG